jgi:hypothetical protein
LQEVGINSQTGGGLSNGAPFEAEINPKFCFFFKRRLHAMLHNVKRDVKRDMI